MTRSSKTPQAECQRLKILLAAHEHPDWSNQQIAQEVGCSDRQVRKWRQRWTATRSYKDKPRSGAPRKFSAETRVQVTALACSLPQEKGRALSRWSASEITRQMIRIGAATIISVSTIKRWLWKDRLKPWRYRQWQHIHDPKAFMERAKPILELYETAKQLQKENVWLVCVDEKTSIQAREGEENPRPAQPDQPQLVSPRYHRHGAVQLFAGLSVADGRVYGQARERKRFVDFQAFVLETLAPEALRRQVQVIKLILDNGTTHAPKQLEKWLAAQVQKHRWPFKFEIYWLPVNASWLDQIEIWFSILQRKLLQPNHFESKKLLKDSILNFIQQGNENPKPINWTYTVDKLQQKLGTNL